MNRDEFEAEVWYALSQRWGTRKIDAFEAREDEIFVDAILTAADQYRDWAGDTPEQRRDILHHAARPTKGTS